MVVRQGETKDNGSNEGLEQKTVVEEGSDLVWEER